MKTPLKWKYNQGNVLKVFRVLKAGKCPVWLFYHYATSHHWIITCTWVHVRSILPHWCVCVPAGRPASSAEVHVGVQVVSLPVSGRRASCRARLYTDAGPDGQRGQVMHDGKWLTVNHFTVCSLRSDFMFLFLMLLFRHHFYNVQQKK